MLYIKTKKLLFGSLLGIASLFFMLSILVVNTDTASATHWRAEYCKRIHNNENDRRECRNIDARNMTVDQFCEWFVPKPPTDASVRACVNQWSAHPTLPPLSPGCYRKTTSPLDYSKINCGDKDRNTGVTIGYCYAATTVGGSFSWSLINCQTGQDKAVSDDDPPDIGSAEGKLCDKEPITADNCGIVWYIVRGTQLLSALVGIVVVIMIAVGGIQYSTARDNPQAVQKAKGHIINALLALAVYIFTMAILQWLIPGGIFQ